MKNPSDIASFIISSQRDFFREFKGGSTIPQCGIPGGVALFGESAFPIIVNGSDSSESASSISCTAIAGGAFLGAGRVIAVAHNGYVSNAQNEKNGPFGPFLEECQRWVTCGERNPIRFISNEYFTNSPDTNYLNSVIEELKGFVWNGGGVIVSACPWGWAQIAGKGKRVADMEANVFLASVGMAFLDGYFGSKKNAYDVFASEDDLISSSAFHGLHLLQRTHSFSEQGLNNQQINSQTLLSEQSPFSREVVIARDPTHLVAASTELESARVTLQNGNWWAIASDHLWFVMKFPVARKISRIDCFCANPGACPKELVISVCLQNNVELKTQSYQQFSSDSNCLRPSSTEKPPPFSTHDKVWTEIARFPYPTNTKGKREGNGVEANERLEFRIPAHCQKLTNLYKIDFVGIHNSHYIGVNDVWFYNMAEPEGSYGALAAAIIGNCMSQQQCYTIMDQCKSQFSNVLTREPTEALPLATDAKVRLMHGIVAASCKDNNKCAADPLIASLNLTLPGETSFPGRALLLNQPNTTNAPPHQNLSQGAIISGPINVSQTPDRQWLSTFFYANPSQTFTVTITAASETQINFSEFKKYWKIRVGCHSDTLLEQASWSRWPCISNTYDLPNSASNSESHSWSCAMDISHRFGGIIFFESVADNAPPFTYNLKNVHRCPHVSSETNFDFVDGDAPWGEFVGHKIAFCLPREILLKAAAAPGGLREVVRYWDTVVLTHHQLSDPPYGPRRRERIVCDRQISCGYMHSGYPIMTHMDFAGRCVDLIKLRNEGDWGAFHELGHNMQRSSWTWADTLEVSVNWFTVYTLVHMLGKRMEEIEFYTSSLKDESNLTPEAKSNYKTLSSLLFIALMHFMDVVRKFGWDSLKSVMRSYETNPPPNGTLNSDTDKMGEFIIRFSQQVGHNLLPYFTTDRCHWPVAVDKIHPKVIHLPVWRHI